MPLNVNICRWMPILLSDLISYNFGLYYWSNRTNLMRYKNEYFNEQVYEDHTIFCVQKFNVYSSIFKFSTNIDVRQYLTLKKILTTLPHIDSPPSLARV